MLQRGEKYELFWCGNLQNISKDHFLNKNATGKPFKLFYLDSFAKLNEVVQDDVFWQQSASLSIDLGVEVATFAILHHDVESPLGKCRKTIKSEL